MDDYGMDDCHMDSLEEDEDAIVGQFTPEGDQANFSANMDDTIVPMSSSMAEPSAGRAEC
ncbi:hypothetical protein E2562_000183 [Oryza meyeriana var. granulata]|uniref:Uncharacterized protein n=1 Tax=Oryza meyeriana var. granulata TaxID=110450 RepID=A0A6G1DBT1_9ORYZ|nr:hypothetical protein E2562_000183 [Oryza meyeriana var. granulata]